MLIFDYFFLIFVCNVIGGDGVPPDGVVFPTTTAVQLYILHTTTTYNFPHILKKSIDSEDGTTVVNRKRHGLPRPQ